MSTWKIAAVVAAATAILGAVYMRLRWQRSPRAYRAMIVLGACYFAAGAIPGALVIHLASLSPAPVSGTPREAPPPADTGLPVPSRFSAMVVSIADGDTVAVVDDAGRNETIRLAGIDAPEHDQAFGQQSAENLAAMISGKAVALDCENERSYGRLICKILLDGKDVCLEQVKAGMAWHYKQFQDEQSAPDRRAYGDAE